MVNDGDGAALVVPPRRLRAGIAVVGARALRRDVRGRDRGSPSRYDWLEGLARTLMVGAPIAVGLYAHGRPPFARFGSLLIGAGAAWFVSTLSGSQDEVVYSVGRVGGGSRRSAIVYLVLAFPTGRLADRVDRLLLAAILAVVLVSICRRPCWSTAIRSPRSSRAAPGAAPATPSTSRAEPAFVEDLLYPLREVLLIAIPSWSRCGSAPGYARRPR